MSCWDSPNAMGELQQHHLLNKLNLGILKRKARFNLIDGICICGVYS